MILNREDFAKHLAAFQVAERNPEYGGGIVDWLWDWLLQHGTTGPATGPTIRWLQLRTEDSPYRSQEPHDDSDAVACWKIMLRRLHDGKAFMEYHHQGIVYDVLDMLLRERLHAANNTR